MNSMGRMGAQLYLDRIEVGRDLGAVAFHDLDGAVGMLLASDIDYAGLALVCQHDVVDALDRHDQAVIGAAGFDGVVDIAVELQSAIEVVRRDGDGKR